MPWHDTKSKEGKEEEGDEAQKTGGICMCAKWIECHFLKFIALQSVCRPFLCSSVVFIVRCSPHGKFIDSDSFIFIN